jgi:signal transduction histidine kinase
VELAPAETPPPLLALPADKAVLYTRALPPGRHWTGQYCAWDSLAEQWSDCPGEAGERAADTLEAHAFISAPLHFQGGEGRVFIVCGRHGLRKADALFLCHVLAQVVPVLENIHLLDRLASDAALRERQTISRDLHDSTVQPYIGLSYTLAALRNKAAPDNPLREDIGQLAAMSAQVVADLRRFAGGFASTQPVPEPLMLVALRQHLDQVRQFHGLDIALELEGDAAIGDRLAGALFQLVCEGVSNIRKHSAAKSGTVRIARAGAMLAIDIENTGAATPPSPFLPASISQRSAALGGSVRVSHRAPGVTAVHITIPV